MPTPPLWVELLHESHCLYFVGGFVFCRKCAFVTSTGGVTPLTKPCRKYHPKGSHGMLASLEEGRLAIQCWQKRGTWPNGAKSTDRLQPSFIAHKRAGEGNQASSVVSTSASSGSGCNTLQTSEPNVFPPLSRPATGNAHEPTTVSSQASVSCSPSPVFGPTPLSYIPASMSEDEGMQGDEAGLVVALRHFFWLE